LRKNRAERLKNFDSIKKECHALKDHVSDNQKALEGLNQAFNEKVLPLEKQLDSLAEKTEAAKENIENILARKRGNDQIYKKLLKNISTFEKYIKIPRKKGFTSNILTAPQMILNSQNIGDGNETVGEKNLRSSLEVD